MQYSLLMKTRSITMTSLEVARGVYYGRTPPELVGDSASDEKRKYDVPV